MTAASVWAQQATFEEEGRAIVFLLERAPCAIRAYRQGLIHRACDFADAMRRYRCDLPTSEERHAFEEAVEFPLLRSIREAQPEPCAVSPNCPGHRGGPDD